jgi:hypothetical protein
MKRVALVLLAVVLSACSSFTKIEGDQVINNRMAVKLSEAWNKVEQRGTTQPYNIWTQEGVALDQLRFWAGVRAGESLVTPLSSTAASRGKAVRLPTYAAGMPPDQIVNLFEVLYAMDGSRVTITKVDSAEFAGEKGVRFEFAVTRKNDEVQLLGVGWASVKKGELFAASFVAPKLTFFAKLLPRAETIVKTAQIKS